jgi:hypothetical protein
MSAAPESAAKEERGAFTVERPHCDGRGWKSVRKGTGEIHTYACAGCHKCEVIVKPQPV